jgi:hypothetical protein
MKNTKWKLVLALSMTVAVFIGLPYAEADVTFRNNSDRKVYVARYTDIVFPITQGWISIESGKSWIWKNHAPSDDNGYYAEGTKDGKNLYWRGDYAYGWVHPTKAFRLDEYGGTVVDGGGGPKMQGVKRVGFRKINLDKKRNATVNIRN